MAQKNRCAITSATIHGVEVVPVTVEVAISSGLPGIVIVGMPDAAIQEARERVRAGIRAAGFEVPHQKIVVNLAPSSLKKTGSGFDVPIALGILMATAQIDPRWARDRLFVGELSLEGRLRPVTGSLAYAMCARRLGRALVCAQGSEPVPLDDVNVFAARHLAQFACACEEDNGLERLHPARDAQPDRMLDFSDVAGHEVAKRAFQIAAAGNHGLLMMGPPGAGKTMLASRMPSILPPLSREEMLETAVIHSVVGEDVDAIMAGRRPFRSPHHSASLPGLVGGGNPVRPGEISLAHHGVLFLDELAEFKASVLQGIRQPMESGNVTITRADGSMTFPAEFMLVAASNPCPCGYYGDTEHTCICTVPQMRAYQNRIGGPLMDRIDLHLDVRRIPPSEVFESGKGTDSATLREGVLRGRAFASWRMRAGRVVPSHTKEVIEHCRLNDEARAFVVSMGEAHAMSGRSLVRVLNVARTIADMAEEEAVSVEHVAEALAFRLRDGIGGA